MRIYISLIVGLIFLVCFCNTAMSQQESITIATYYPAPYGVYITLRTLNNGNEILINGDQANPGIELRDTTNSARQPYIDFSNDNAANFDYRITLVTNNQLWIRGGTRSANPNQTGTATFVRLDGTPSVIRVGEVWFCSSY